MAESDTRQNCLLWWRPQRTDLTHYFPRKRLSQLVVSQAVFTLLVIMQIIWKLVAKGLGLDIEFSQVRYENFEATNFIGQK